MNDQWATEDAFRSILYGLACVNGEKDPVYVIEKHKVWCERVRKECATDD